MDIHPEPEHSAVEIWTEDRATQLGSLDESTRIRLIRDARRVLASLIQAGYFAYESATTFDFLYHFDSVDAWLSYMATYWTSAVIDPAMVARARNLLAPGAGEVRIRRRMHCARLRRCNLN